MMLFVDTSALVKRYVAEASSAEVLSTLSLASVLVSRLTQVEVMSAFSRLLREGRLTPAELTLLKSRLLRDLDAFEVIELTEAVAALAGDLLARHPLRANDAVQLASCLHVGAVLGSNPRFLAFDARLNQAATAEGLDCQIFDDPKG